MPVQESSISFVLSRAGLYTGPSVMKRGRLSGIVRRFPYLRSVAGRSDGVGRVRKAYCIFNQTRESFLSLNVAAADTHFTRLKGLLGRMRLRADEGIWVIPSQGVHSIGLRFSVDLIYLDDDHRVIHLIESFGTFRIGPVRRQCASVLELPTHTIYSSQTEIGDQLIICSPEELVRYLKEHQPSVPSAEAAG